MYNMGKLNSIVTYIEKLADSPDESKHISVPSRSKGNRSPISKPSLTSFRKGPSTQRSQYLSKSASVQKMQQTIQNFAKTVTNYKLDNIKDPREDFNDFMEVIKTIESIVQM